MIAPFRTALALGLGVFVFRAGSAQAAPPNDNFAQAERIAPGTNLVSGSNVDATLEPGEAPSEGASVWWTWSPDITGTIIFSTVGSDFDTFLEVFTGDTLTSLMRVAADDDSGGQLTSRLYLRAYAGETLYIRVSGAEGETGQIQLHLNRPTVSAPKWDMTDPKLGKYQSQDFTNKVLIVDFFETTCGGCIEESDDLVYLQKTMGPRGFSVIAAVMDEDAGGSGIAFFQHNYAINYPMAFPGSGMTERFVGIEGVPFKFVIDRENKIVTTRFGAGDTNIYLPLIEPLLRSAPSVRLRCERQGDSVTIAWSGAEFGWSLQGSERLDGTDWTAVDRPIAVQNGENTVTLPADEPRRYLRLTKP